MARRPFFTGDYGSALGRIDTRPIMEAGRAQAQMFAGLGADAAKAIETYQLNKEERAKLTGEIEQDVIRYAGQLTQTPNQETNQKNLKALEKFNKGDSSMSDIRYLAGQIGRIKANLLEDRTIETGKIINDIRQENLALLKGTRDSKQKLSKATAALAEFKVNYENATNDAQKEAALAKLYAIPGLVDQQVKLGEEDIKARKLKNRINKLMAGALPGEIAQKKKLGEQQLERGELTIASDEEKLSRDRANNKVFQGVIKAFGSEEALGMFRAGQEEKLSKLQLKKLKTDIEKTNALIDYYEDQGLAALLKQFQGDTPPTFSESFNSLAQQQAKLLTTTVEVPLGGAREEAGAVRLPLKEYLDFNAEDPTLFPINGQAQILNAMLKNTDLQMQDLMKRTPVKAFVPEGEGAGAGAGDASGAVVEELDIRSLPADNPTGAIADRVTELRNQVEGLEQELVELRKPGAKMTVPSQIPMGAGGFTIGQAGAPATVGYVQDETKRIQGEIIARRKEMERLEKGQAKLGLPPSSVGSSVGSSVERDSVSSAPATPVQRYLNDPNVHSMGADKFIRRMVREAKRYQQLSDEQLRREMESLNIEPEIVDQILRAWKSGGVWGMSNPALAPNPTPMQFQR